MPQNKAVFCAVYQGPNGQRGDTSLFIAIKIICQVTPTKKKNRKSIALSLGFYTALQGGVGSYGRSFITVIEMGHNQSTAKYWI